MQGRLARGEKQGWGAAVVQEGGVSLLTAAAARVVLRCPNPVMCVRVVSTADGCLLRWSALRCPAADAGRLEPSGAGLDRKPVA